MLITPAIWGASTVLPTIASFSHTATEATTITVPATVVAGDLMYLWDSSPGGGIPTDIIPSGFTKIATYTAAGIATAGGGNDWRMTISYKLADADDFSDVLTGLTSTDGHEYKILSVFRGTPPFKSITASAASGQIIDSTAVNQVKSVSGKLKPFVIIGNSGVWQGSVDSRIMTPVKTSEQGFNISDDQYVWWRIVNVADTAADTTVGNTRSGADVNMMSSCIIELT